MLLAILLVSAVAYGVAGFCLASLPGSTGVFNFLTVFAVAFLCYIAALFVLARLKQIPSQRLIIIILTTAALFRLLILPAGMSDGASWDNLYGDLSGRAVTFDRFLLYDHDVWRYLWDGHQQAVGLNPYRYSPSQLEPYSTGVFADDPMLEERLFPDDTWRDIWENINYQEIPTPYPPLLQLCFRISHTLAPGSIVCWKLILILIDLLLCLALAMLLRVLNLPIHYLAAYAWNPLVIKELAGSAHADVIPALFIVLALLAFVQARTGWGSGLLALGILAKLSPLVLLPFVWRRMSWRDRAICAAIVSIGFLPFISVGKDFVKGFSTYSQEWIFNPGVFELFRWIAVKLAPTINPALPARVLCAFCYLILMVVLLRHPTVSARSLAEKWLIALGGLLFFSATIMPWYLIWFLPLAALCRRHAWLIYSALCFLSYWVYIRGDGSEEAWRLILTHGGFLCAFIIEEWQRSN
ncbi:MAG: hypothetical protein AB1489_10625 [Acidobacteriota bacterium]